jgi:hypothetical protein
MLNLSSALSLVFGLNQLVSITDLFCFMFRETCFFSFARQCSLSTFPHRFHFLPNGGSASNVVDRMFLSNGIGSPYPPISSILVVPGPACLSLSTFKGHAFSIATVGSSATFTVTAIDSFGNIASSGGESFSASGLKLDDSILPSGFSTKMSHLGSGTYSFAFASPSQGAHSLVVLLGSSSMMFNVFIHSGAPCASKCVAVGYGLTLATAGHMASFSVWSRDSYGNYRTTADTHFALYVIGPNSERKNVAWTMPLNQFNSPFVPIAVASYRTTHSGQFATHVMLAGDNGLTAKYFSDSMCNGNALLVQTDSNINFDWGSGSPSDGLPNDMCVTWSGFVKPDYAATYTFRVGISAIDERVQLWVDNARIIDSWFTAPASTHVSGTIYLRSNALYDIQLRYRDITGTASVHLQYDRLTAGFTYVPSSRLFAEATSIQGSPFSSTVFPAMTCGTLSILNGDGLSLATAGVKASFTITARDHLGNVVSNVNDMFAARVRFGVIGTVRDAVATVTASGINGVYHVAYTPNRKGTALSGYNDLVVSLAVSSGLLATYYSSNFASPIGVGAAAMTGGVPHSSVTGAYSARYRGFFRPSAAGASSISVTVPAQMSQFSMYLDGFLVASASGNTSPLTFSVANGLYDVEITVQSSANTASASLMFGGSAIGSRLLQRHDVVGKIWDAQGLYATFYNSATAGTSPLYTSAGHNLDWSYSSQSPKYFNFIPVTFTSNTIRWQGFFKPTSRGLYTFYVQNSAGSGSIVLDNQAAVAFSTTEVQATVFISIANYYYDITVELTTTSSASSAVQLFWSNDGLTFTHVGEASDHSVPKQIIPVSSLFGFRTTTVINRNDQHLYYDSGSLPGCGGTSSGSSGGIVGALRWYQCRGAGSYNNGPVGGTGVTGGSAAALKLLVHGGLPCGTTSSITTAISRATAGMATSFNIRLNDAYGNVLDSVNSAVYIAALPQSALTPPAVGAVIPSATGVSHADPGGRYTATYTLTQSGNYWVTAAVVDQAVGGLTATVTDLSGSVLHSRVDPSFSCCESWPLSWKDNMLKVKWSGFIRMNDPSSNVYTFHLRAAEGGTKLYISSKLVINCASSSAPCSAASSLVLSMNAVYDVTLEHSALSSNPYVSISYSSATRVGALFDPRQMYAYSANVGNGLQEVVCDPDSYNSGLQSFLHHPHRVITAGIASTFTIESRDKFGNLRLQSGALPDCSSAASTATACVFRAYIVPESPSSNNRPVRGTVTVQSANSFFNVAYTVTVAGMHTVSAASYVNWVPYGIAATYYNGHDFSSPATSVYPLAAAPSWSLTGSAVPAGSGLTADGMFSVRLAGAFFAASAGLYTAYTTHSERLRVFIDFVAVIDQRSYSGASQVSSGTLSLAANTFHEFVVEMASDAAADSSFAFEIRNPTPTALSLTASNVFFESVPVGSPVTITVVPNVPCGAVSILTGDGLSLATSGVVLSFSITCRDGYSNLRLNGGDIVVARAVPAVASSGGYIRSFLFSALPYQHNQFNGFTTFSGGASCPNCVPQMLNVADMKSGLYIATGTAQKTGWYKMTASVARSGGLTATYAPPLPPPPIPPPPRSRFPPRASLFISVPVFEQTLYA